MNVQPFDEGMCWNVRWTRTGMSYRVHAHVWFVFTACLILTLLHVLLFLAGASRLVHVHACDHTLVCDVFWFRALCSSM